MGKAIMIQGTGSNVGKSLLVAGLSRAFVKRGLKVRPFKPQNMSNNAAATPEGGEIGRAQALQAQAAKVPPHWDMNPVLLKPQSQTGAQVIVHGARVGTLDARDFGSRKASLMPPVLESFDRLVAASDLVIVEGAGSPAETNLRRGDIANMGFARAASVPVILVGDIDRGGVIAQIVGTGAVLDPADRAMIKGFIINRFRGDIKLFDEGRDDIAARTGWPCLGVVPWFDAARNLPAEDVMDIVPTVAGTASGVHIAVPHLPRIANFDDLDPLAAEPGVTVDIVPRGRPLPARADVILLVGSKATIADLGDLRQEGWDIDLAAHIRRGRPVLGLCGGYQMLGKTLHDPHGIEGPARQVQGLGHLDVHTTLSDSKEVGQREGHHIPSGTPLHGYEIHMGQTNGPDCARGWLDIGKGPHGAVSDSGLVVGCYLHGLFASDAFRGYWLGSLGTVSDLCFERLVEDTLDELAAHLEDALDLDLMFRLAAVPGRG